MIPKDPSNTMEYQQIVGTASYSKSVSLDKIQQRAYRRHRQTDYIVSISITDSAMQMALIQENS